MADLLDARQQLVGVRLGRPWRLHDGAFVLVGVALVYGGALVVGVVGIVRVVRVVSVGVVQVDHLVGVVQAVVGLGGGRSRGLLRGAEGGRLELLDGVGGQVVEVMVGEVEVAVAVAVGVGHGCSALCQWRVQQALPERWRCRAADASCAAQCPCGGGGGGAA